MEENAGTAVPERVVKLHSNIDRIHQCIQSLSHTASHDAELERSATERKAEIAELRPAHGNALRELAAQREKEAQDVGERSRKKKRIWRRREGEYEGSMAR